MSKFLTAQEARQFVNGPALEQQVLDYMSARIKEEALRGMTGMTCYFNKHMADVWAQFLRTQGYKVEVTHRNSNDLNESTIDIYW